MTKKINVVRTFNSVRIPSWESSFINTNKTLRLVKNLPNEKKRLGGNCCLSLRYSWVGYRPVRTVPPNDKIGCKALVWVYAETMYVENDA